MANRQRGRAVIEIDGKKHEACLTLGAMAELENRLDIMTPGELELVMNQPTQNQMVTILHCLINFKQDDEVITEEQIRDADLIGMAPYIAIQKALATTMPTDTEKKELAALFPKMQDGDPQNGQSGDA